MLMYAQSSKMKLEQLLTSHTGLVPFRAVTVDELGNYLNCSAVTGLCLFCDLNCGKQTKTVCQKESRKEIHQEC